MIEDDHTLLRYEKAASEFRVDPNTGYLALLECYATLVDSRLADANNSSYYRKLRKRNQIVSDGDLQP